MVPESAEPGAEKKYYLFPLNIQVSDEWTPWTLAAQLDTKYPDFMDRFKRFTPVPSSEIPRALRIRWFRIFAGTPKEPKQKWQHDEIPPC
jgi:hypothetical protein